MTGSRVSRQIDSPNGVRWVPRCVCASFAAVAGHPADQQRLHRCANLASSRVRSRCSPIIPVSCRCLPRLWPAASYRCQARRLSRSDMVNVDRSSAWSHCPEIPHSPAVHVRRGSLAYVRRMRTSCAVKAQLTACTVRRFTRAARIPCTIPERFARMARRSGAGRGNLSYVVRVSMWHATCRSLHLAH